MSLNNSGVSLLEHARYEAAKATLKDALDHLAGAAPLLVEEQQQQFRAVNAALHRAEQLLAQPHVQQQEERPPKVLLTVLSSQNTDRMETAALDFCSSQCLVCVRIDDDEEIEEEDDEYNVDILTCLLLNYGVACQCCAGPPTTNTTTKAAFQQAWHAVHLAHEILSRRPTHRAAAIPKRRSLLLHMLIVSHLMHLSSVLGRSSSHGRYKYYDTLCRLREELPSTDEEEGTSSGSSNRDARLWHKRQTAPAA